MPTIRFANREFSCEQGANLRRELLKSKAPLYNGIAAGIHCRGLGTCGTCAVKVDGDVSEMTAIERWRLGFPPHRRINDLRLACQCKVLGDVTIQKFPGLWGHRMPGTAEEELD